MAKAKQVFSCSNCAHQSIRWLGCCPGCNEWNSFSEQVVQPSTPASRAVSGAVRSVAASALVTLEQIDHTQQVRMCSGVKEWDRVLGGGIVPGSFLILTGDPGIGKSTLLLQIAHQLAQSYRVVYVSSEESLAQVKGRALRLGLEHSKLLLSEQSSLEVINQMCLDTKPDLLILDSIQNCHLSLDTQVIPGTIAQLREAAFRLMRLAKENNIAIMVTGHITKEREMAGPKLLEHMVDGVFYLQGEDRWQTRMLRSIKNRFGTINEVGFFQMQEQGMEEVSNINQLLLQDASGVPGSALVCSVEGTRPLLLELQALVVESKFGIPQRVISGIDPKQVVLVAAILEKYLHIRLSSFDIFFKVSGGFKSKESSADLGIALALLSSYYQQPLPAKSVAIAEISLTGQIKPTNQIGMCVREVEKFGLQQLLVARAQQVTSSCKTNAFANVQQLISLFPE